MSQSSTSEPDAHSQRFSAAAVGHGVRLVNHPNFIIRVCGRSTRAGAGQNQKQTDEKRHCAFHAFTSSCVLKIVVAQAPALFYGFFFQRWHAVGVPMPAASGRPLPSPAPCVGSSCMPRSILMETGSSSGSVTPRIETVTF